MNRFSILAIIASVAMVSCSNTYEAKTVELADKADSVNYYLGYLTASNIKRQAFRDIDSTKYAEATAAFMDAFAKGYTTEKEELTPAAEMGKNMGGAIKNFETKGLGGVSAWGINEPLFFQGLVNAIEKDTVAFNKKAAMDFLQASFQGAPQEKVDTPKPIKGKCGKKAKDVKLASFNDSINYAYGYYFGGDVENYLLANDTTGKALDEFVEALNKTVGSKAKYPELAETAEQIARQIKEQEEVGLVGVEGLATNFEVIKQGFINGFNDFETLDAATMNAFIETTINDLKYGDKIKEGQAFLDAKAQEEGVLATGSGLLYKVIKEGKGAKPAATDKVKVHYEGKLIDGTVFDSSYQRGEPIEFGLNQVIPGWTEGVQLMSVGSTYELYIPYTLGYGERGAGAQIPPFSTLIFKVELLGIVK